MSTSDLKEYLEMVVDMEKNIFLQNQLISQIENQIPLLGKAHTYERPVAPTEPQKNIGFSVLLLFVLSIGIGIWLTRWGLRLLDSWGFLLGLMVFPTGLIFIVGGVWASISLWNTAQDDIEKYNQYVDIYNEQYTEYEKNTSADDKRVRNEKIKKTVLKSELQVLKKQNNESKKTLECIYSKNIIFPKYRNLVMVCAIYEYFCAGRCTKLEGHDGAYNILEMEIRLDRITMQLDQVIARLDSIQSNQYILYSAIKESNRKTDQIIQSTQHMARNLENYSGQVDQLLTDIAAMQKNSAMAVYQAERIQTELRYMNRMNYFSGKYSNVFYNFPPT